MKQIYPLILLLAALMTSTGAAAAQTEIDSIVAIVDESIITSRELLDRMALIKLDLKEQRRRLPDEDVLRRQVLETLISESLMFQEAERRGIRVTESQLNQAMQRLARQNNITLAQYRQALINRGLNYEKYRETVRRELAMSTLARQFAQRSANISEAEVDEFIASSGEDDASYEYRLSHILIALPDAATPEKVNEAQAQASEILSRLDQGEEFDQLANTFSSGETALQGGDLGWRKKAEIPSLFTSYVNDMKPGDYAGPIRSASGFHVVYLNERRNDNQVLTQQVRSRHILIRPNELITDEDARQRLQEFRQRILDGEDFGRLARLYSVDYTSGSNGGDIGWMDPGATVREYQATVDQLKEGELSQPFRSQFGWHLVEVTGRRTVDETEENKRNKIRSQLLEQKQREAFDLWKRRLRDEAYVTFPQQSG